MAKVKVPNWAERSGTDYWKDRIEVMKDQDDKGREKEKMLLFDELMGQSGKIEKLADIGCGIGRRNVAFPGLDYYGFDREIIMVEEARKRYPQFTFNHVDGQELAQAYPDYKEYFDVVSTYHVVQYNHVDQQVEIFKGFHHLLRPGGYLYLKENTIYAHNNKGMYSDLQSTHSVNKHSYTEAGWVAALKRAGFELVLTCGKQGHYIFKKV